MTLVAAAGTGLTALNLLWPRASTNPTFDQISGTMTDSIFRHIPMSWYIVGVPVLIGIVYYAIWQRNVEDTDDRFPAVTERTDQSTSVPVDAIPDQAHG